MAKTVKDVEADQQILRPPTLRDVAALAGVSIATVSKALNGRDHVRKETRQRVEQAAEKLNFFPNLHAQSLHSDRSGTVGLLTSDLVGRFSIPVMLGAEDAFGTDSMSVFLCDARGDAIREQHHLRALLGRRVDGLIVVGDTTNPRRSLGQDLGVPVVYAYSPSEDPRDMSVVSDNVAAGRQAVEHVLSFGRSKIAYVSGDRDYVAAQDRVRGAIEALRDHGLELLGKEALYGAWSESWGRGAAHFLLENYPELDTIVCASDEIARGVVDILRESGRRVPDDVAVIGHDNWEQIASQSRPPLTTIDMNLELIGRRAAQLLFAAIDGHPAPGPHIIPTRLVTRQTTTLST
ncbi:LacI family DNA-binding transcriptional regulator [Arthrobacter sp. N1]|uniref:LacI family DNA-binding transcriptional regulator n=1 Tax=Arthrobacter sp. N1 TaxID=619291 RepID=UPI003BB07E13